MQEFYKGQKLYYRYEHHICECEVIGWNHHNVYLKLRYGTFCTGPKWRVGFTIFNSKKALIAAEEQRKHHAKEVEESIPTINSRNDKYAWRKFAEQQRSMKGSKKPKSKRSGKRGIERPPKKRGGDQYINGINSYGTYKSSASDRIIKRFEKPVTGERPSYKDTPSNEELSQYNTERKHGMPAAGKDMNTRSISKGSIYSKAAPRMKGSYGHHYKKKK